MVRKSVLVYDLLRTAQPEEGFSQKEIVEQISNKHDITAGKSLKRQVAVALRRGVDFGIIVKKNNRFRFDPDSAKGVTVERSPPKQRPRTTRKKTVKKTTRQRPRSKANNNTKTKTRKQGRQMPQPKLPKSWTPNRRNLVDEPVSKVKKI